jgi:outer membrane murein-binding lipoprotein Lpp
MHRLRLVINMVAAGGLAIGCLVISGGCSDDSKTTGTQLKISPEVKAEIDNLKSSQKALRAERKAAAKKKGLR